MQKNVNELSRLAQQIRRDILDLAFYCNGPAHIGGALSIAEIMAVLYGQILKIDASNPRWQERDRFILSKGHAVLALYSALHRTNFINEDVFSTFKMDGSELIAHPVLNMDLGIESSNGSLGHGLSMAIGVAWALKRGGVDSKSFVLLGDGECDEGSIWEGVWLASNLELNNLVVLVDFNGFQSDGIVPKNSSSENMAAKWRSFGWQAHVVDGHDIGALLQLLNCSSTFDGPTVIVAKTIKGKGVSFMENENLWHHNRLTESFYLKAIAEVSNVIS